MQKGRLCPLGLCNAATESSLRMRKQGCASYARFALVALKRQVGLCQGEASATAAAHNTTCRTVKP